MTKTKGKRKKSKEINVERSFKQVLKDLQDLVWQVSPEPRGPDKESSAILRL